MCKTHWNLAENYHSMEIFLEEDLVIIKNWFDPGKNPNIHRITFDEFLEGKFDSEIMMAFGGWVVKEIRDSILLLKKQ